MKTYSIEGVEFLTDIEEINVKTASEIIQILSEGEEFPICKVTVTKTPSGEYDCDYYTKPPKFERIRRITGYLVGTMDRWNDAKREEEADRIKHEV